MRVVAILSQKGGAGKTTIAVNLATAAELADVRCAIIDLDPQASSTSWGDSRAKDAPAVVSAQASRLTQVLEAARKGGAGLAIIDTAPHSESASLAAARLADFILIPCRPAILDLRAINHTIDLVRLAAKPVAVILNCVPARGSLAEEAIQAVEGYGVEIAPVQVGQRAAYLHSLTAGLAVQEYEPDGKAAAEIRRLYLWTCRQVGMYDEHQEAQSVRSLA